MKTLKNKAIVCVSVCERERISGGKNEKGHRFNEVNVRSRISGSELTHSEVFGMKVNGMKMKMKQKHRLCLLSDNTHTHARYIEWYEDKIFFLCSSVMALGFFVPFYW